LRERNRGDRHWGLHRKRNLGKVATTKRKKRKGGKLKKEDSKGEETVHWV